MSIDWSQFILQLISILVPVAAVIAKTNQRVTRLEEENESLRKANSDLAARLDKLTEEHTTLQARYERSLQVAANLREKF